MNEAPNEKPQPESEHDIPHNPLLMWVGHFFVVLGFIGAVLPIMPGTVFFIIAAYFYARSSKKFYNWLMDHKLIGPHIKNYQAGKITTKGKWLSISSMTVAILISIFLVKPPLWVTGILIVTNVAVSIYILRFRSA